MRRRGGGEVEGGGGGRQEEVEGRRRGMEGKRICSRTLGHLFVVYNVDSPSEVTQNASQCHSGVEWWPSWIRRRDDIGAKPKGILLVQFFCQKRLDLINS